MRRFVGLLLALVLALLATELAESVPEHRGAQEATPEASPQAAAAATLDVYSIALGSGVVAEVPPQTSLRLRRVTFEPGTEVTHQPDEGYDLSDASFVVFVESGSLTVRFDEATSENGVIQVRRAGTAEVERLQPGSEVTVQANDSFYVEDARYLVTNPSDTERTDVLTAVLDPGAPPDEGIAFCCVLGPKPRFP